MIEVKALKNNPFQENTYVVYNESGSCFIIDPGMNSDEEEQALMNYIADRKLKPTHLLNTHCHIDHVLGNRFVYDHFNLKPQFHEGEIGILSDVQVRAPQFGLRYELSPVPDLFLPEKGEIALGEEVFEIIFVPGHSPAHLCFYHGQSGTLIGGDVLFRDSIGRTDLPGGNHELLLKNIREKLYILPDDTVVYPGHGPTTTIGYEKNNNPYVRV